MAYGYYLAQIGSDGEPEFTAEGLPIPSGPLVELPPARWGRSIAKTRQDIVHETELGRRWVYHQFDRRTLEITFRCLSAGLEVLRALDEAVGGQRDPFLLVLDVDASPNGYVLVRKTADFDEGEEQPVMVNGDVVRLTDYVLILSEEPTGTSVTT